MQRQKWTVDNSPIVFALELMKELFPSHSLSRKGLWSLIRFLEFIPYMASYRSLTEAQKQEGKDLLQGMLEQTQSMDPSTLNSTIEREETPEESHPEPILVAPVVNEEPPKPVVLPAGDKKEEEKPLSVGDAWQSVKSVMNNVAQSPITKRILYALFYMLVTVILLFNVFILISLLRSTAPVNTVHCDPTLSTGYRVREWFDVTVTLMKDTWKKWRVSETPSPEVSVSNLT